jgi:hypothetical protein
VQLQSWFLPALVGLLLVLQLVAPYRGWRILLVGLGGVWLVSCLWARSLARGLRLTRDLLDRPEARPGQQGHWGRPVSGTGRTAPVRQPREIGWKVLW